MTDEDDLNYSPVTRADDDDEVIGYLRFREFESGKIRPAFLFTAQVDARRPWSTPKRRGSSICGRPTRTGS